MTYAQAQTEIENGKDVVLTIKNADGKAESVTFQAEEYTEPCVFMMACNNLLRGLRHNIDFVFSSI